MRRFTGWRRPLEGIGVDYGASGVKAVVLSRNAGVLQVLGAGHEPLAPGAIRDGVVRDPDAVGAALRGLLSRLGARSRLVGLALGGSSVLVKRFPAPSGVAGPGRGTEEYRLSVAREAARHVPFHLESLEFDYEGPLRDAAGAMPAHVGAGGAGAIVFGAAPREIVREHCRVATLAGREVARVELEAYALYRAVELQCSERTKNREATDLVIVEIGAGRAGVHVFRGCPLSGHGSGAGGMAAGAPEWGGEAADLLASVPVAGDRSPAGDGAAGRPESPPDLAPPGGGAEPWRNLHSSSEGAADRLVVAVREALVDAGVGRPVRILLSGGGAQAPGVRAGLQTLGLGEPATLDPLEPLGAPESGPRFAVAAGLAYQQILDGSRPGRRS
jgi:hypothetical protein